MKISEYPLVSAIGDTDKVLISTQDGTKNIYAKNISGGASEYEKYKDLTCIYKGNLQVDKTLKVGEDIAVGNVLLVEVKDSYSGHVMDIVKKDGTIIPFNNMPDTMVKPNSWNYSQHTITEDMDSIILKAEATPRVYLRNSDLIAGMTEQSQKIVEIEKNVVSPSMAQSLLAIIKKCAFTESLTDEEKNGFMSAWNIEGEDIPVNPPEDNPVTPTLTGITVTWTATSADVGTNPKNLISSVKANYSDGTSKTVTGYTVTPSALSEGSQTVTVTYQGKTATKSINGNAVETPGETIGSISVAYSAGTPWEPNNKNAVTATISNMELHGLQKMYVNSADGYIMNPQLSYDYLPEASKVLFEPGSPANVTNFFMKGKNSNDDYSVANLHIVIKKNDNGEVSPSNGMISVALQEPNGDEYESGYIDNSGNITAKTDSYVSMRYAEVEPSTRIKITNIYGQQTVRLAQYDSDKKFIKRSYEPSGAFNLESTTKYVRVGFDTSAPQNIRNMFDYYEIEVI